MEWLSQIVQQAEVLVDRLLERRLVIGVTGFSGSGKSTLLTSLIHQLHYTQNSSLSALAPSQKSRLLGVELLDIRNHNVPRFPYTQGVQALSSDPPKWPEPTKGISSALLELRYRPKRSWRPQFGKGHETLYLEITDYPGEWLLDLPMMEMSYLQWSLDCKRLFNRQPRQLLLGSLFDELERINPLEPLDEAVVFQLHRNFVSFLKRCKKDRLSVIQPGRFLLPDQINQQVIAPFVPMLSLDRYTEEQLAKAPRKSLYAQMQKRYDSYLDQWITPFYQQHFSAVQRHLVLIDVMQALNAGPAYLDDMQYGLDKVLNSFDYGENSLIQRLFAPKVEKVIFVATKIDQVLPDQHENVRALASELVHSAYRKAQYDQVEVHTEAVAAVRSTTSGYLKQQPKLIGVVDSGQEGYLSHPPIPEQIPTDKQWQQLTEWNLRRLLPPVGMKLQQGGPLPHIRLDSVIRELIGDKF